MFKLSDIVSIVRLQASWTCLTRLTSYLKVQECEFLNSLWKLASAELYTSLVSEKYDWDTVRSFVEATKVKNYPLINRYFHCTYDTEKKIAGMNDDPTTITKPPH